MKDKTPTVSPDLSTLVSALKKAKEDGFTHDFLITEQGLQTKEGEKYYQPGDVEVKNFHRFEGVSDPDDTAILYLIETADGKKGTVTDAYGMYANPVISAFMDKVTEIHKKDAEVK